MVGHDKNTYRIKLENPEFGLQKKKTQYSISYGSGVVSHTINLHT